MASDFDLGFAVHYLTHEGLYDTVVYSVAVLGPLYTSASDVRRSVDLGSILLSSSITAVPGYMALLLGRVRQLSPYPRSHDVLAMRYQTSGLPNGLGISGIGPGRWPPGMGALVRLCVVPLCSSGGLVASHWRLCCLRCRESDDTPSLGLVDLRGPSSLVKIRCPHRNTATSSSREPCGRHAGWRSRSCKVCRSVEAQSDMERGHGDPRSPPGSALRASSQLPGVPHDPD